MNVRLKMTKVVNFVLYLFTTIKSRLLINIVNHLKNVFNIAPYIKSIF